MWHAGEQAVQIRIDGKARRVKPDGGPLQSISSVDQQRFFAERTFALIATAESLGGTLECPQSGYPLPDLIQGPTGFLRVEETLATIEADGPHRALAAGTPIALIAIDFAKRQRCRLNGRIIDHTGTSTRLSIDQIFLNCPRYITDHPIQALHRPISRTDQFSTLNDEALALIARSDVYFAASINPVAATDGSAGLDISHRGGSVLILDDGSLVVPDFPGNHYFNTLGNLTAMPRAGLLFLDFQTGERLQIVGDTEIIWDGPLLDPMPEAERAWRLSPTHINYLRTSVS